MTSQSRNAVPPGEEQTCEACGAPAGFFPVNQQEAVLLCSSKDCLWPLDASQGLQCLPISDPRVLKSCQPSTSAIISEAVPAQASLGALAAASSASLEAESWAELQRISNVLFQPSPACSPAVHGLLPPWSSHVPMCDSLPPSTALGPAHTVMEHEGAAFGMFELPPAASPSAAAPAVPRPAMLPPGLMRLDSSTR